MSKKYTTNTSTEGCGNVDLSTNHGVMFFINSNSIKFNGEGTLSTYSGIFSKVASKEPLEKLLDEIQILTRALKEETQTSTIEVAGEVPADTLN